MASFAKLTTDWQTNQTSYLDNFVDFILGAMAAQNLASATPEEMVTAVSNTYGLRFPVAVTHQIARRAARRKQLDNIGSGQYVPHGDVFTEARAHSSTVQDLEREQSKLVTLFKSWVEANAPESSVDKDDALPLILDYVESYYGPLMSASAGRGSVRRLPVADPSDRTRLAAAFIAYLSTGEPEAFDYVLNIAKGSMLAASLFSPGAPLEARPFRDTTIVLDTRVILQLLGFEGEPAQAATTDYLQLAAGQGAHLGCFEFTLTEIRNILWSADAAARSGNLWSWKPGSVGAYFWNKGLNSGDITIAIGKLRDDIESAGIVVIDSPTYMDPRYVVDEDAIEGAIKHLSANYSDGALKHDVQALSAIVRMRAGSAKGSLEECRAVFVTTNSFVLRASRRVEDMKSEPWFVSILDTDLASLTWIKTPLLAPNLPKGSLVATCLSVLNPSDAMWGKYVREFERRHDSGQISDAELVLARRITEEHRVRLSMHQLETDAAVSTSIDLNLAEARATLETELSAPHKQRESDLLAAVSEERHSREVVEAALRSIRDEVEAEKKSRQDVEAALQSIQEEVTASRERVRRSAVKRADRVAVGVAIFVWMICLSIVLVGVFAPLPAPIGTITLVVGAILVVTGGAGAFISPLRGWVRSRFLNSELARVGLATEGASEPSGPK